MAMGKRIELNLPKKDEELLLKFIKSGSAKARSHLRAEVLLMLHNGLCASDIKKMFGYDYGSTRRTIDKYHKGGIEHVLFEQPRSGRPQKITPSQRARITALACTKAPKGRSRWTLNLLKDTAIELKYVESISRSQIARILKKTS